MPPQVEQILRDLERQKANLNERKSNESLRLSSDQKTMKETIVNGFDKNGEPSIINSNNAIIILFTSMSPLNEYGEQINNDIFSAFDQVLEKELQVKVVLGGQRTLLYT